MPVKGAAGRTLVSVPAFIIPKAFRGIDVLLLVVAQPAAQIAHVRANALASQGDEVLGRAILAITHHRAWFAGRVLLVLRNEIA